MKGTDFSWAQNSIFKKINNLLGTSSTIENLIAQKLQSGMDKIARETFIEVLEELNTGIDREDAAQLADELVDKETDRVDVLRLYAAYYKFFPKEFADSIVNVQSPSLTIFMEQIRKSAADGFFDVGKVFRELDTNKTGFIDFSKFEISLRKINAKIASEQARAFFNNFNTENTGQISYMQVISALEDYSCNRVSLSSSHVVYDTIMKIRVHIKSNPTNTFATLFKDLVKPNLDGKRWITKKDFKEALRRMNIVLNALDFEELSQFLDKSGASQIDFDYFCEVVGYVQPLILGIKIPDAKEESVNENTLEVSKIAEHSIDVDKTIEDIAIAVKKGNYKLAMIFADQDYEKKGLVTKAKFIAVMNEIRGLEFDNSLYLSLSQYFEDPISHEIDYESFLSKINDVMQKFKAEKPIRKDMQWANQILDDICVFLYRKRQTLYEYFELFGFNHVKESIQYEAFEQGIKEMKINIRELELDRLKEDLDVDGERIISGKELLGHLENNKEKALKRFHNEILLKLEDYVSTRNLDLYNPLKKYDVYGLKYISSKDFNEEIRMQFKGLLRSDQYEFLMVKYESEPGRIDYMNFIKDAVNRKFDEEGAKSLKFELIWKYRENIRTTDLKITEKLLTINSITKVYSTSILLDIFPRTLLPIEDYSLIAKIIDEKRSGKFTLDDICNLFWINQDEEAERDKAPALAKQLNLKIKAYCSKKSIDLLSEFKKVDKNNSNYLSVDEIKDVFNRLQLKLSFKQLSAILYFQKLPTDAKWCKNYIELVKRITEEAVSPEKNPTIISAPLSLLELQRYEELKSHTQTQGGFTRRSGEEEGMPTMKQNTGRQFNKSGRIKKPFTTAKEIQLNEELLMYMAEQMSTLRKYLQDREVDIRSEFSSLEKDGYIDFDVFCKVMTSHEIDLNDQEVLNAFYSYLKEEEEGKISCERLYDAVLKGKLLTQYKPPVVVKKKPISKEEIIAAGNVVKRLAEFVEEKRVPLERFKTDTGNVKVIKKDQLDKILKGINFPYNRNELEALFKIVAIREDGQGSVAHLLTIINEQLTKKKPQKLQIEINIKEYINILNKEIININVSQEDLYKILNVNTDGYVDKNDFVTALGGAGFKIPAEKLGMIFTNLDVYKLTVLSIDYLLVNVTGVRYKSDTQIRHLPIDEQVSLEVDQLFQRMDELHNGIVSEDELFKAVSASSHNKCTREEVKEVMKRVDVNQNGFLTKEDFAGYMVVRIQNDIMASQDSMEDLRRKLNDNDIEGNGWLAPEELYKVLVRDYPAMQMEDLEELFEEINPNKDERIDINDFIDFMSNSTKYSIIDKSSKKYKAVLTLKHQRRYSPNEFLNYFEKISSSVLYTPSFIMKQHSLGKSLPSESFKLARNYSGLSYIDVDPVIGLDLKPTNRLKEIPAAISGYLILNKITGVPIPDPIILKRENILGRLIKVAFYDNVNATFLYGSTTVLAGWTEDSEDIWTFNSTGMTGTNPIVYKWADSSKLNQFDIVFELIVIIKYIC